jgi:polysaccharide biosynthesis protein PslH
MKVLFLTNVLPFHRRNGGEVCTSRLIDQLCSVASRVLVVGRGDAPSHASPTIEVRPLGVPATEFASMSRTERIASLAAAVVTGKPWTVWRMGSGVMSALRRTVGGECFDHVFVDHLQVHAWYRRLGQKTPAVLVAHNVESRVYGELLARTTGMAARWVLAREQRLLDRLDNVALREIKTVACLTAQDRDHYAALAQRIGVNATVEVLPSYFQGTSAAMTPLVRPGGHHKRRIGLLGTWTWESNRLGMDWFLRDVLPLIDPGCEVLVAGRGLEGLALPASARYIGFVESAAAFYGSCDTIAIASTHGGGVQEKTIEAIGTGVPMVATSVAVRGIDPVPPHVQVMDSPHEFAAACSRINTVDRMRAQTHAIAWNEARRTQYSRALDRLLAASALR